MGKKGAGYGGRWGGDVYGGKEGHERMASLQVLYTGLLRYTPNELLAGILNCMGRSVHAYQ